MSQTGEFQMYLNPKEIGQAVLALSQIEGVAIRLPMGELPKPDPTKTHGAYILSFDQLAPLIISVSGAAAAFVSLATAIFQLKTARTKGSQSPAKSSPPIVFHIQNNVVPLEQFAIPQELADYLSNKFHEQKRLKAD